MNDIQTFIVTCSAIIFVGGFLWYYKRKRIISSCLSWAAQQGRWRDIIFS
jgi:hypothetical protein